MNQAWYDLLSNTFDKQKLIDSLASDPTIFEETVVLAYSSHQPQSWRACWALEHVMAKNDIRIAPHVTKMILKLSELEDGHQRELLKVLQKMNLNDEQEGRLFDAAMTIWESIHKKPSVRHIAFRYMTTVIEKYPDLWSDMQFVIQQEYLDTLSPGVKQSLTKEITRLKQKLNSN